MSTIGTELKMTLFGESHGPGIGVTLDGLPAGEEIDFDRIATAMARRAPGNAAYATARKEADLPKIISGVYEGKTTGMPVCAVIENSDMRSADYSAFENLPRPGHADYTAKDKYKHIDLRGGGHFSGRLTAPLVFAGALCAQILERRGILIAGHVYAIGEVVDRPFDAVNSETSLLCRLRDEVFPVIDSDAKEKMSKQIAAARAEKDSIGGIVEIKAEGLPSGLGGPLFDGLEGKIAACVFGIPAVKGLEFGEGFAFARLRGSAANDSFYYEDGVKTETNHMGGILGGISNGMPLIFRVAFKPTPSIAKTQKSVDLLLKEQKDLVVKGRHDPCVVPRAVPCVEAAAAIAILEQMIKAGRF